MSNVPISFSPILIASISALLAYLGWSKLSHDLQFSSRARRLEFELDNPGLAISGFASGNSESRDISKSKGNSKSRRLAREKNSSSQETVKQILSLFLAFFTSFLIALVITTSIEISLSISLLFTALPFIASRRKLVKLRKNENRAWPIAIDAIISSLQAGQSISESIQSVSAHGPPELSQIFQRIEARLEAGEVLEDALEKEIIRVDTGVADQTLTALILAKEYGGRDVTTTLRMLSSFLREENDALEEIETKFGWVRNSALLGAIAPWLLLALLSTQKSTIIAYQSSAGRVVLSIGVIATAIAFIWMDRVARLPDQPRPLKIRA